jgi:hypothetical protein
MVIFYVATYPIVVFLITPSASAVLKISHARKLPILLFLANSFSFIGVPGVVVFA